MSINPNEVKWDDDRPDSAQIKWDDEQPTPGGVVESGNGAQSGSAIPANRPNLMESVSNLLGVVTPSPSTVGKAGRVLVNAVASPFVLADRAATKLGYGSGKAPVDQRLNQAMTDVGVPELDPNSGREQFAMGMARTAPAFALPGGWLPQILGNAGIAAADAPEGQEGTQALIGGAFGSLGTAAKLGGKVLKHTLGMTSGVGGEAVEQAFKAGAEGNPVFAQNMRGNVDSSVVVDQAKTGLANMRQQMYDRYSSAKGGWADDTTPLNFTPITQGFDDAAKKFSFNGVPQPGIAEVGTKVQSALADWAKRGQADPRFFTVEGLDALKRHLQDLAPDFNNPTGRAFVTDITNKVKQSIVSQRPDYARAMTDYWQSSNQLDEISRSLSLGDKATTDTALRKLQSLMRNNVNTNYGQRIKSAQALADQGGQDILPAIAGQAMNSWTPRGIQAVAGTGLAGYGLANPAAFAVLPAQSPRLVGEAAHLAGKASRSFPIRQSNLAAVLQALRAKNNDQR